MCLGMPFDNALHTFLGMHPMLSMPTYKLKNASYIKFTTSWVIKGKLELDNKRNQDLRQRTGEW